LREKGGGEKEKKESTDQTHAVILFLGRDEG
jgi:hypothetical protein